MDDLIVLLLIASVAALSLLYQTYLYHLSNKSATIQSNTPSINVNTLPHSIQTVIDSIFTDLSSNKNNPTYTTTDNDSTQSTSTLAVDAPLVYAAIQELIDHIINNFIDTWYKKVNANASPLFKTELRQSLTHIAETVSTRCATIDWSRFVVKHIVMQLTYLLKVFRLTKTELMTTNSVYCSMTESQQQDILSKQIHSCYQLHPACTDNIAYTRRLSAALLSQLLRSNEFNCTIVAVLCREILTFNVLVPAMNFVQPFWINTAIVKSLSKVNASVIARIDSSHTQQTVQQVVNQVLEITSDERAAIQHAELERQHSAKYHSNGTSTTPQSPQQYYTHHVDTDHLMNGNKEYLRNNIHSTQLPSNINNQRNLPNGIETTQSPPLFDRQRSKSYTTLATLNNDTNTAEQASLRSQPHLSIDNEKYSIARSQSHNNITDDIVPIQSQWSDIYSIRIVSADIRFDNNKKPYVSYAMNIVHHPSNNQWTVTKRYSEFLKLHKKLKRKLNINDTIMPKKHIFDDHLSQSFIQQRKEELSLFITQLCWNKKIQNSDIFRQFLSPLAQTSLQSNGKQKSFSQSHQQPFSPTSFSRLTSTQSIDYRTHHSTSSSPSRSHRRLQSNDDTDIQHTMSPGSSLLQHRASYLRKSSSANDLSTIEQSSAGIPTIDPPRLQHTVSVDTPLLHTTTANQPYLETQASKSRLLYYKSDHTESTELTQPLVSLIEEILDLNSKGYIGRKAVFVVKNIIKLTMSTVIHSWLNNSVGSALSQTQVVKLITTINRLVFPNGKIFTPSKPQSDDEKNTIKLKAQDLIVHELPASIKTLLGTQHCQIALLRVFEFLQTEPLLQHFSYSLLDAIVLELFPELSIIT